jgi:CrcB protein
MSAPAVPRRPAHPEPPGRLVAIALGGALGTLARYAVARAVVVPASGFPWATFTVNVAGSFLLGVLVTLVTERWPPTRYVRPFAAIGFCGGFTTFSTLAVESVRRFEHGAAGTAGGYLAASLVAGTVAAAAGIVAARGGVGPRRAPAGDLPDPDDMGTLSHPEPDDLPGEAR